MLILPILFAILLFATLLALSVIDIRDFLLPNYLTLPLIPVGILQSWLIFQEWQPQLIGAIAGFSIFVFIEYSFKIIMKKDGLGRGDAKLLAVGGAWCGWAALPTIILIGSCLGLIMALAAKYVPKRLKGQKTNQEMPDDWIPFGPFLAVAIFGVWLTILLK